jgi:hypothetical protein
MESLLDRMSRPQLQGTDSRGCALYQLPQIFYAAAAVSSNKLVVPMNDNAAKSGRVVRRQRLGGLLNFYQREAA